VHSLSNAAQYEHFTQLSIQRKQMISNILDGHQSVVQLLNKTYQIT